MLLGTTIAAAALLVTAVAGHAQTAYTIGGNGTQLVRFDLATPNLTTVVGNFSGDATIMDGIDFRPANGQLYGFGFASSGITQSIVTIDVNTAVTTFASMSTTARDRARQPPHD